MGADEHIMQYVTRQKEMLVFQLQVLSNLQKCPVRNYSAVLAASLFYPLQTVGRVIVDETSVLQPAEEGMKPGEIVVVGLRGIVALDVDIVQKLGQNDLVYLVRIVDIEFLETAPVFQKPEATEVVAHGLVTE